MLYKVMFIVFKNIMKILIRSWYILIYNNEIWNALMLWVVKHMMDFQEFSVEREGALIPFVYEWQ